MKLSEIVAEITNLKTIVAGWVTDKTKATADAISGFQSKLSSLETGAASELSQKSADLVTAQQTIETISADKAAIISALDAACAAVKIEGGDAAKLAAMTPQAKIASLQTSVSDTMAKLNVPASAIPAGKPAATVTPIAAKKYASADEEIAARKAEKITITR